MLAWFLIDLAGYPFCEMPALKGGTALRRRWFEDYRFSEDLDFTLTRRITFEKMMVGLNENLRHRQSRLGPENRF